MHTYKRVASATMFPCTHSANRPENKENELVFNEHYLKMLIIKTCGTIQVVSKVKGMSTNVLATGKA